MAKASNNGTGSVILIGTLLQINATLIAPNGLTHRSGTGFQENDRISITASDSGNRGSEALQTNSQFRAATVAGVKGGTGSHAPNANSPLGVNLSGIADWNTQLAFVDVFKAARPWTPQKEDADWGKGEPLDLSPQGWIKSLKPKQYATTFVLDNGGHYLEGQYVLLYDGQGKLEIIGGTVVSQSPGRMLVKVVKSSNGIGLNLRETNPSNPLRNIRFLMPGTERTYKTQPFYKGFLKALAKFKVIRFMDWQSTNGSPLKNWSERTTPTAFSQQSEKGVALEHMIHLVNTLKADPWFTIPHQATDDFVRQFATMVRDRLDPSLKVHVEYSNEVWNGAFSQAQYASKKGRELGLSKDDWEAGERFYAQRSVEIFKIWEDVFRGKERLIREIAWQAVNPNSGEQVLKWKNTYQHADEYAIAPYFNAGPFMDSKNIDSTLRATPDQIIEAMRQNIRDSKSWQADSARVAKKYGLRLVAYEGGQDLSAHWVPSDKEQQLNNLFKAASRSPRMRDLYVEYLNQWKQLGGGLLNQFTDVTPYTKWGHWGALEYQDQPPKTAPKYQGIMDFINANPTH